MPFLPFAPSTSASATLRFRSPSSHTAALALCLVLSACGGGSDGDAPLPNATLSAAASDTLTQPGSLAAGSSTDDTTPRLSGSLSGPLAAGQKLQVYDGSTALSPAATVTGQQWQFTPSTPLAEGEHRFSVAVLAADGTAGPRSPVFALTVALPTLGGVSPAQAVRATPTVLSFSGSHWPSSGLTVAPVDDARATCDAPTNPSATALQVSCTLYTLGERKLELRLNNQPVGQVSLTVGSNVSSVTWASPSTEGFGTGTVRLGEVVSLKVSGTQLLADPALVLSLDGCAATPTEQATPTATERLFTCTLAATGSAGQKAATLLDGPGGQALLPAWQVPVAVAPAAKLPHSGITAAQCYQAGSDALVACSSAGAIALSGAGKQDGMLADVNPMSYSSVGSYSKEECVKDNVTGLMWEGKAASGARAGSNAYTNYGDGRAGDASAYVAAVNAQGLCGFNDWRLPTVDELQSIVDYGIRNPGPTINSTWFVNTPSDSVYCSSSPYAGNASGAWVVVFANGYVGYGFNRDLTNQVRLVRASQ